MDDILLKIITENYAINSNIANLKINKKSDYPHILDLSSPMDNYIVKKISKTYCKNINDLYNYLQNINFVEMPIKNIFGEYSLILNNEIILLYKRLFEIDSHPSPIWWANCLDNIHNIDIKPNDFKDSHFNIYEETYHLLNIASSYLSDRVKKNIYKLLDSYDCISYNNNIQLVLSHGDTNDANVMLDNKKYKLIDTDGMRLLPKEFDIQRLLHNKVNNCLRVDDAITYWNEFLNHYKNKIDISLLKKIYVYDLIRVFSWLTLVSNDLTRIDRERQKKEFELYKESILEENHSKILKKM